MMQSNVMPSVIYAECHSAECAECRYAECHYAACRGAKGTTPKVLRLISKLSVNDF